MFSVAPNVKRYSARQVNCAILVDGLVFTNMKWCCGHYERGVEGAGGLTFWVVVWINVITGPAITVPAAPCVIPNNPATAAAARVAASTCTCV